MNFQKVIKNDLLILISFILIFYIIYRISGTFSQGYNIYEDNQIISISENLETQSFISVFEEIVKSDILARARFRPFYSFHLALSIKIFETDLTKHTIYIVFLGAFTSFFLFKFSSTLGFSKPISFLFSLLTLMGPAAMIWAELSDAEIIGLLMLSV